MTVEQSKNIEISGSDAKRTGKRKANIFISILKYIAKGLLAILIILSIIFQLPWKVITLLAILFAATTILPKRLRKWFWFATGSAALILIVWILFPENNTGWRPYTFDNEIAALEEKYKIPDKENAAFAYYEIFKNLVIDSNSPEFFLDPNLSSLDKPWLTKDHPKMAAWINSQDKMIEKLILASKIEKCILPPNPYTDRFGFEDDLPKIRYCVYLLIASANNDIAENRIEDALEKYFSSFRIANQLHQFPSHTHISVHWAIQEKTLMPFNNFITEGQINKEQLQQFKILLDGIQNDWSENWSNSLDLEKLSTKDEIASLTFQINDTDKLRYSRLLFEEDVQSKQNAAENTYNSGISGKLRAILRWIFFPPSTRTINNIVDKAFERHYAMANSNFDWNRDINLDSSLKLNYRYFIKGYIYSKEYLYKRLHQIYLSHVTLLRGSRLLIDIKQYKESFGKWPDNLDEIKSLAPAEAFIDPATGKQLQYENLGEEFTLSGDLINIWPMQTTQSQIKYMISNQDDPNEEIKE